MKVPWLLALPFFLAGILPGCSLDLPKTLPPLPLKDVARAAGFTYQRAQLAGWDSGGEAFVLPDGLHALGYNHTSKWYHDYNDFRRAFPSAGQSVPAPSKLEYLVDNDLHGFDLATG